MTDRERILDESGLGKRCGFCGSKIADDGEWSRDPWDGIAKWVCADAESCAKRGRARLRKAK